MKGSIKAGGGSNVRSPVYAEMGALRRGQKFLGRHAPLRGQKQRARGGR